MAKLANGDPETGGAGAGTGTEEQLVRVIVTGGLGFVGSAVVRAIQGQHPEWTVWIVDKNEDPRKEQKDHKEDELDLLRGCRYLFERVDITNQAQVMEVFAQIKAHAVVHTAGIVPGLSERYARRLEALVKKINVDGTRHVVEAARLCGCKALVYTSSCCAVTDDMSRPYANIDESWPVSEKSSSYGESKVEAERVVLAANNTKAPDDEVASLRRSMFTCVLRPSVLFGEGDNQLIPPIHACIAKQETRWVIGDGTNLWDTTYVGNVADAHVLAVENLLNSESQKVGGGSDGDDNSGNKIQCRSTGGPSAAGEIFFIQNNEPISFREFSLAIWKEFGHYPPPLEIPIPKGLAWILGLVADAFTRISGTPTTLSRGSVMDACAIRYASGEKAERVLGYSPQVGLEVGIKRSCQDYARRLKRRQTEP